MIIDTSLFSDFLAQNKDVLTYPVKSYPINEQNFARWIANHSEPYRPLAVEFRRSTRHVSFSEFKETIGNIFSDILQYIYTNKPGTIFLYVYPDVKKSNFFVALYIYSLLEAYQLNIPTKIITNRKDFTIVKPNDLVIFPDDASYSGTQLYEFLAILPPYVQGTYFMAIPYMSSRARLKIENFSKYHQNSVTLLFSDKTHIFEPFLGGNMNLYTIYFDHKLADYVSTYNDTYSLGYDVDAINDPRFIYEPMSLITGCEAGMEECPAPFYKLYNYKYNSKNIAYIDDIGGSPVESFTSPTSYYQASSPPSFLDTPPSFLNTPPSFLDTPPSFLDTPPSFLYTGSKRRSKNKSKRRSKNRSKRLLKR